MTDTLRNPADLGVAFRGIADQRCPIIDRKTFALWATLLAERGETLPRPPAFAPIAPCWEDHLLV